MQAVVLGALSPRVENSIEAVCFSDRLYPSPAAHIHEKVSRNYWPRLKGSSSTYHFVELTSMGSTENRSRKICGVQSNSRRNIKVSKFSDIENVHEMFLLFFCSKKRCAKKEHRKRMAELREQSTKVTIRKAVRCTAWLQKTWNIVRQCKYSRRHTLCSILLSETAKTPRFRLYLPTGKCFLRLSAMFGRVRCQIVVDFRRNLSRARFQSNI